MMSKELKKEVKNFWNRNSMAYDIEHGRGGKEFYRKIDDLFFEHHKFGHDSYPIFSKIINYRKLKGKLVLEVGCGLGTMAAQFAEQGAKITAIDITHRAVELTLKRFKTFGMKGNLEIGDAENLSFKENTFDFVFSWGVLHHTPDTQRAVDEIYRVLRHGGKAAIMLYHKYSFLYYYHTLFKKGLLKGEFLKYSKDQVLNRYTDFPDKGGTPLAKVYTKKKASEMFGRFKDVRTRVFGMRGEMENIPLGKVPLTKWMIPEKLRDKIMRKYGWFLYIEVEK